MTTEKYFQNEGCRKKKWTVTVFGQCYINHRWLSSATKRQLAEYGSHTNINWLLHIWYSSCLDNVDLFYLSFFLSVLSFSAIPEDVQSRALLVCLDSQLLHMSLEQNGLVTENCNHCSLIGFELCRFLCAIHWRGSITFHQLGHVRVWMNGIPVSWVPFTKA